MKKFLLILLALLVITPFISAETVDVFLAKYDISTTLKDKILTIVSDNLSGSLTDAIYEVNYILKLVDFYRKQTTPQPIDLVLKEVHYSMGKFSLIVTIDDLYKYFSAPSKDKISFLNSLTVKQYSKQFKK